MNLPNDIPRCEGRMKHDGEWHECPQREECLRYLVPPANVIRAEWLYVTDEPGDCLAILPR